VKNTYRLVISVNMLQRSVAVEIDRDCLQPVAKESHKRIKDPKHEVLVS
jgi:hypothetical protein